LLLVFSATSTQPAQAYVAAYAFSGTIDSVRDATIDNTFQAIVPGVTPIHGVFYYDTAAPPSLCPSCPPGVAHYPDAGAVVSFGNFLVTDPQSYASVYDGTPAAATPQTDSFVIDGLVPFFIGSGSDLFVDDLTISLGDSTSTVFSSTNLPHYLDLHDFDAARFSVSGFGPVPYEQGWRIGGHIDHLQPVPEPSTVLLLVSGLAGLAGVTWRRSGR
jgi:hypothetical protein